MTAGVHENEIAQDTFSKPGIAGVDPTLDELVNVQVSAAGTTATGKRYGTLVLTQTTPADVSVTGNITAAQPTQNTPVAGGTVALALGAGQATWLAELAGPISAGTTLVFDQTEDNAIFNQAVGYDATATSPAAITSVSGPLASGLALAFRGLASGLKTMRVRASSLQAGDVIAIRIVASSGALGVGAGSLSATDSTNLATAATQTTATATEVGPTSDTAYSDGTGAAAGTLVGLLKGIFKKLAGTLSVSVSNQLSNVAQESGGNLQTIASQTSGLATHTDAAGIKSDLDEIATDTDNLAGIATSDATTATQTTNTATATGAKTDANYTDGTGAASGSLVALLKGIFVKLAGILGIQQADLSASGTISAAQPTINTPITSATVVLAVGQGQSTWKAQLLAGGGGFTSGTTIVADKSPDGGTTWYATSFKVVGASPAVAQTSVVGPGPLDLTGNAAGISHIRIRCSVLNSTETIAVTLRAGAGVGEVSILGMTAASGTFVDGSIVGIGTTTQTKATDGSATSWSAIQLLKGIFDRLLNTVAVSGTVTANAGTNLNTSALAQEAGGNLATIAANTADLLADGDHQATIDTSTSAINTATGAKADANYTDGTGAASGSVIALLKGVFVKLAGTLTVSGTVTANAGTNMSTASLAQEAGGNLATIAANTADLLADGDHLAAIDTNTSTNATNTTTIAGAVTSNKMATKAASGDFADGALTTLGLEADSAITNSASSGTLMAFIKGIVKQLAFGQNTMSNSQAVAIASDQSAVPVKRSTVAAYSLASTTTSGSTQNSGDITVGSYTEIAIDINTTAQAGTSPTIQYFYERKGADGIYYILWQTAVLTLAANTVSTSIGAGMAYNQSLGATGRLRWVIGGSATPTFTHSINVQGK